MPARGRTADGAEGTKMSWWQSLEADLFEVFADRDDRRRTLSAAVLAALLAASARGPMWTLSEIQSLLREVGYAEPVSNEVLAERIARLIEAGCVTAYPNHAEPVTSYSDGARRREAWSLTREGRVVVAAVRDAQSRLERTLQLPARLLDSVEQTLRALVGHYHADAEMLAPVMVRVRTHLEQLQEASGDFYSAVGALAREDVSDDRTFSSSCQHILVALQHFARRTEQALGRVRSAFEDVRTVGVEEVARRALTGAGVLEVAAQDAWVVEHVRDLADLEAWFVPGGSVELLVNAAADAVQALLGAIDRRFYAATRGSDVGADFRQIARMVHAQPEDRDAYRVFAAAFGVWPSRHPLTPDEEDVMPLHSSASGSALPVRAVLRRSQRGAGSVGRPRVLPDLSKARQAAASRNEKELDQLAAITLALVTPGRVPLSYFDGLDPDRTQVLVALLDEALGSFSCVSGCGSAESLGVRLTVTPGERGGWMPVRLEGGTLTTVDLMVEVSVCTAADTASGPGVVDRDVA